MILIMFNEQTFTVKKHLMIVFKCKYIQTFFYIMI